MSEKVSNESQSALKKPIGVIFLAFLFILAPLGNITISFMGSGIHNWFQPNVFLSLLQTISVVDWVWLSLLVITGVLLLRPHKLSWTMAIITLTIVLGINAFRLYEMDPNSIEPHFLKVFSLLAVISTLGVLTIAFYFRFPYLDRRANWFKNIERHAVQTDIIILGETYKTESLSTHGCRIKVHNENKFKADQNLILTIPEVSADPISGIVILVDNHLVRIEFLKTSSSYKSLLGQLVNKK